MLPLKLISTNKILDKKIVTTQMLNLKNSLISGQVFDWY